MARAHIYTRITTPEQAERSSPAHQERSCRQFAAHHNLEVASVTHEIGSATQGWRALPALVRLVDSLRPGDLLLVEEMSRLTQASMDDDTDLLNTVGVAGATVVRAWDELWHGDLQEQMGEAMDDWWSSLHAPVSSLSDGARFTFTGLPNATVMTVVAHKGNTVSVHYGSVTFPLPSAEPVIPL